jgi:hypothetical protein
MLPTALARMPAAAGGTASGACRAATPARRRRPPKGARRRVARAPARTLIPPCAGTYREAGRIVDARVRQRPGAKPVGGRRAQAGGRQQVVQPEQVLGHLRGGSPSDPGPFISLHARQPCQRSRAARQYVQCGRKEAGWAGGTHSRPARAAWCSPQMACPAASPGAPQTFPAPLLSSASIHAHNTAALQQISGSPSHGTRAMRPPGAPAPPPTRRSPRACNKSAACRAGPERARPPAPRACVSVDMKRSMSSTASCATSSGSRRRSAQASSSATRPILFVR